MANKTLLYTIIVLLTAIAGYLGYLVLDRHQHNQQESAEQAKEDRFDAAFLGESVAQLKAERAAMAASDAAASH